MSPFDALLCERSQQHAADWQEGFSQASLYVSNFPERSKEIHAIVAQGLPGNVTAQLLAVPYSPEYEGFWHGVYGEVEYQRVSQ